MTEDGTYIVHYQLLLPILPSELSDTHLDEIVEGGVHVDVLVLQLAGTDPALHLLHQPEDISREERVISELQEKTERMAESLKECRRREGYRDRLHTNTTITDCQALTEGTFGQSSLVYCCFLSYTLYPLTQCKEGLCFWYARFRRKARPGMGKLLDSRATKSLNGPQP